ncbi:MAG: ABC transporter substrate-binding protein [Anaerolineaceae bacterium]|nr:ABC transporter substrate-binding protein [Anaerolineaceae bacterium]
MKRVVLLLTICMLLMISVSLTGAQEMTYSQAPMLDGMDLPELSERLPAEPLVVEPADRIGVYGGTWHMGLRGGNDGALLVRTIGNEGLVRWNLDWTGVVPNVAASYEVNEDGTEYTFNLREGMKWSDGMPFTANDIVFWYNAHATNTEVSPAPPNWMVAGGEIGTVEAVDDYTVKFSFAAPNGLFLQRLATPDGNIVNRMPQHYAEQFHAEYNPDGIEAHLEESGLETWVDLWTQKVSDEWYTPKPTINAWVLENGQGASATQVTAVRNPYYWKVDPEGNQYPYIDYVQLDAGNDTETLVLRALNGEIDMMDRHIATLANKAVFFDNMEAGGYHFYETVPSSMNGMIIALNLTHLDPVKREIFQNKDFRIGLSHAINRQELIDLIWVGQGQPHQLAPRPTSPFYNEQLATQYTEYNVDLANEHLDAAGYTERDADGYRLGPDGNRISFVVDIQTVGTDQIDAMELITGYWQAVGIDGQANVIDRSILYQRKEANQADATVWGGDGGLDVILEPRWYFPYSNESNFAPAWQYWYNNSSDPRAEEPNAGAQRQMELYNELKATADPDGQAALMNEILAISAEEFYAIGITLPAPGYGIVRNNFFNVPESMPGAWLYPNPSPSNPFQYFIEGEA